jgi:hypothetical protein
MLKKMVLAALIVGGCGGDDVPSCQESVSHFYSVGCALFDTNGQPFPELEVVQNCKELRAAAPDQCIDELDDLQSCFGGVANNTQCASCSDEQDAILTCE